MDDIILTASSSALLQRIIAFLNREFTMTDLGPLNYFLGVSAHHASSGLFLSQSMYATEILERAHMLQCNPCKTPLDTEAKLGPDDPPVHDPPYTVAWLVLYSILRLPDLIYLMLFNNFLYLCMTLENHILLLSNGFFDMSKEQLITVCSYTPHHQSTHSLL